MVKEIPELGRFAEPAPLILVSLSSRPAMIRLLGVVGIQGELALVTAAPTERGP